jgi:tetratricopeptide (TPR) repeat protein
MRTRPLAAALLLAVTPLATSAPSWAQASAEDPTTDMARARFKEGVGFYDKGQFEQARAAFLQAYALKKHPAVLLNLAWSCLKSGHTLEAQRYFKQFLTESKDITDKQRADANDGLNQANAKLGRIDVVAAAGTEVTVDGDKAGTAPLADPVMVEPGAHTVKFKGPDGATDTDSVTVLAGEKAVARFAKAASPAPAATPPPVSTPSESTATPEPPPPAAQATLSPEAPKETVSSSHKGLLSPPSNVVPVVIGGALVLTSIGVAIGMSLAKQSAQTKANDTANQIRGVGGTSCNPPAPANLVSTISGACDRFVSDNTDVNTDATVGNLAIGAGVVAAAATVVYWLLADKGDDASPTSAALPSLAPIAGPSVGGLSLSGRF